MNNARFLLDTAYLLALRNPHDYYPKLAKARTNRQMIVRFASDRHSMHKLYHLTEGKKVLRTMLAEVVVEKIKEESKAFFGTELASIVLYGSYAQGKESKYSGTKEEVLFQYRMRVAKSCCN